MRLVDADELKKIIKENDALTMTGFSVRLCDIDNTPTIQAVPIEVLDKIRAEIEQEYNKYRNMSEKWDERACGIGITLEIIDKYKAESELKMKECYKCGFNDEDYGCTCPSSDKWYACPIESKKPENIQALKDCTDFLAEARACAESEEELEH